MDDKQVIFNRKRLWLFLLGLSLLFAGGGYVFYKNEAAAMRKQKELLLTTIATSKINQISEWYQGELSDARIISQSPILNSNVLQYIEDPGSDQELKLKGIFNQIKIEHDFRAALLVDTSGKTIITTDDNFNRLALEQRTTIKKAVNQRRNFSSDLYISEFDDQIFIDFSAPLINDQTDEVLAVLVFIMNPADFLYPLLDLWPIPTKSAETFIFEIKGDSILFLNELRYRKNAALRYSIPLYADYITSVQAAQGFTGIIEGVDYRGVDVFAYTSPIPKTPWFLISEIDKSELLDGLIYKAIFIMAITLLLISALGLGLYSFYKRSHSRIYKVLYNRERELSQYQEHFKAVMDSLGDGVITLDVSGKIQYMNILAENLTEWSLRSARNRKYHEVYKVINEETDILEKNIHEKVFKHGIVKELANHTVLVSRSGKNIPIMDTGAPIFDSDGTITGVAIAFQDETEKRAQKRELVKSQHFLSTILDTVGDGIITISGADRTIMHVNKAASEIFNWHPDDLTGKNTRLLYADEHTYSSYGEKLAAGIREGVPIIESELKLLKRNGEAIYCDIYSTFIREQDESILVVNSYRDVTDRKRMLNDLIDAKNKAEEGDRLKSAFLANISHEIRTPLNGIMGFTELISNPDLSTDKHHLYVDILRESSIRMLNTINDIIEIARIESGSLDICFEEVDLRKTANYFYTFFKPEADRKGIQLIFTESEVTTDTSIYTDETKLHSILSNLINNAIKYTEEGFVEFGYHITDEVTFFVKDSGSGISEDQQQIVFNRFVQADFSLSSGNEGLGLGLAIAKAYTEMLNGKIWLESKVGEGSVFKVTIPIKSREEPVLPAKDKKEQTTIRQDQPLILVAEDEDTNYMLINEVLSAKGFKIIRAENGREAIELFKSTSGIQLILMDIKMPEINGCEATKEIRKYDENMPVLALSAHALNGYREAAMAAGCNDYITKPVKPATLILMVEKYLGERKPETGDETNEVSAI